MNTEIDPALYEAGRMSNAVDKIRAALNDDNPLAFGDACAKLLDAKHKYDRQIEERARRA